VKGSKNVSADALSRNTCGTSKDMDYIRVEEIEQHVEKMVVLNGSDQRLEIL